MTSKEKRTFLQCLFSVAWTDGAIAAEEQAILATLFNNVELPGADREVVEGWFDAPPPEPDWSVPATDESMRRTLVEQVLLIAASDGTVDAQEIGLVDRLRDRLGMGDDEFGEVIAKIEGILAG